MKPTLKFTALIFLLGTIFFVSCSKNSSVNNYGFPPPPPPPDTLSGLEFIFDNLTWETGDFFGVGNNDVYVGTPDRPDLFDNPDRPIEVSIRFDTSAVWVNVPRMTTPLPANDGFVYDIYSPVLYVFAIPANDQFVGLKVSIKVKFL